MKKLITACSLLLLSFAAGAQQKYTAADFAWITGTWTIQGDGYTVHEYWKKANDSCLVGSALVIQGKDTIVTEVLRLERFGGYWCYIAQVNGHAPVLFSLVSGSTPKAVVFENKEHDFPQKISYTYISKDEMLAETSGIENGKENREEYAYKRAK